MSAPLTSAIALLSPAPTVAGPASVFTVIDAVVQGTAPVDQPASLWAPPV